MKKSFGCSDIRINDYVNTLLIPEDTILNNVRIRSQKEGLPEIQVGPMDARHLEVLTRTLSARRAIEIGTLGGYSAISIARGLQNDGILFTIESNTNHARVASESFKDASLTDKITLLRGMAHDVLKTIEDKGPFDLVFIDADKENYSHYLDWAEIHLRVGGLLIADNTFAWGQISETSEDKDIVALQNFNLKLAINTRFKTTLLPTGEGLTVAIKLK